MPVINPPANPDPVQEEQARMLIITGAMVVGSAWHSPTARRISLNIEMACADPVKWQLINNIIFGTVTPDPIPQPHPAAVPEQAPPPPA